LVQEVATSTTPGSATAAAKRCSNASTRGTQWPSWLTPITASRPGSIIRERVEESDDGALPNRLALAERR
jgi:hypothetical protein